MNTPDRSRTKHAYEAAASFYQTPREPMTVDYAAGWWTRSDGLKFRQADLEALTERLQDRAVARSRGPEDTMLPAWSARQDDFLITYGGCMGDGYAFVASHDLGRTEQEGRDRIAWLRANRPLLVMLIESDAA